MDNYVGHILAVFMGFFAIMNPIANTPMFLGLTEGKDRDTTKLIARKSLIIAFLIILIFSIAGKLIFELFGLTLPAFKITGGILVFFIGYHMLQGHKSTIQHPKKNVISETIEINKQQRDDEILEIAVSPLAMPILAGPGTITTAMNFSANSGIIAVSTTVTVFGVLCIVTYLFFVFGEKLVKYMGKSALNTVTRMMGLILSVIGVQMLIEGVKGAFFN